MAAQPNADDAPNLDDYDTRDHRELVELWDALTELREAVHGENRIDPIWEVTVTSDVLDDDQRETVETALLHTVSNYRTIVGNDEYIPSGVYWSLVQEYADELEETYETVPDWTDGMSDREIFREVVMPAEMARYYHANPVASFTALRASRHKAEGWLQSMDEQFYGMPEDFIEYVEDEGWQSVLSTMACAACMQDVAQELRSRDVELDLGIHEYQ